MGTGALWEPAWQGLRQLGAAGGPAAAWFVPGRIEVAGKHTDYAGGRSLVCAVERGLALLASRRGDDQLRIHSVTLGGTISFSLGAPAPSSHHWARYPATVARRLRRDFSCRLGADISINSDLPAAAGLSSSSALVVASYLALAWANDLALLPPLDLAGYLAAVESGRAWGPYAADGGVGTHGGSEDHTAILCSRPGFLGQYSFSPTCFETEVALPPDMIFAIASSGILAAKTGDAAAPYNRLADEAATILVAWNRATNRTDPTLARALIAAGGVASMLGELGSSAADFASRLEQFDLESNQLVPALACAFAVHDRAALGQVAERSHALAVRCLHNQVPQTDFLAHSARRLGAVASSPFGAGFGGAVWALVERDSASTFCQAWARGYLQQFPKLAARCQFFLTGAGAPAQYQEFPNHVASLV